MDLINWSLSAIDTIFSTRSLGSGEPVCPDGTFAAGYTRDAWERWQIVCLAALSVEDIEDIYLFGTMITGILLIGLGFALGYRKIEKTGTAVQSLTRLPVWLKLWEERSALRLRLLTGIWILSRWSSRLASENLCFRRPEWTKWTERIAVKVCSCSPQRHNNSILSFSGSPEPAPGSAMAMLDNNPGKSAAGGLSCSLPDYRHYSPPPTKCLRLCSARLGQAGLRPAP